MYKFVFYFSVALKIFSSNYNELTYLYLSDRFVVFGMAKYVVFNSRVWISKVIVSRLS